MGVVTRAKKRQLQEERLADRISSLPDDVLVGIVSLLPTKDGARTQILSSRWRHLWRAAPLNLSSVGRGIPVGEVSRILAAHPGPGRRFSMPECYLSYYDDEYSYSETTLDGWLRSPALDGLQELKFQAYPRLLLPPSVRRFSSTLRVASFGGCTFPDGNNAGAPLLLPVLESLTLCDVCISVRPLHALLAGCLVLQSLALFNNYGFHRLQIVSPSLRSIDVDSAYRSLKLVIEDAPCLERLLFSGTTGMVISVISAPRLAILGELHGNSPRIQFSDTVFEGSAVASMMNVAESVKVLSLSGVKLCLDVVINLLNCFPHLEKLYIKATSECVENAWYQTSEVIGNLYIRLRKIVLGNYQGSKSHVDFVRFFLSNASVLESLMLEPGVKDVTNVWIARQHRLLHIKKNASSGARVAFVSPQNFRLTGSDDFLPARQVHDLSADPFLQRIHSSNVEVQRGNL